MTLRWSLTFPTRTRPEKKSELRTLLAILKNSREEADKRTVCGRFCHSKTIRAGGMQKIADLNLTWLTEASFGWFDFVVLGLMVVGLIRGRKRGMSEELLHVFQWLLIVVGCSRLYKPLGLLLSSFAQFSHLTSYLLAYLLIAIGIKFFFSYLKRAVGEKLVGSDIFGRLEYYLGMSAGMLRYACMTLVFMALLNAKYISEAELKRVAKVQQDNFGNISFPTLGSLQQDVFKKSFVGSLTKAHLADQLIYSGPADKESPTPREGIGQRRTKEIEDVIDGSRKN
jgi:uncharacterized membrane protein required for colicin V production